MKAMKAINKYFVFHVGDQRFALPLLTVQTVIWMVEVNALPKAPEFIKGVINFHGEIIPVVNLRNLFGIVEKQFELSDHLIIVKTPKQILAIWAEKLDEIIEREDAEILKSDKFFFKEDFVQGLIKFEDNTVLIQDIDKLLSDKEIKRLKNSIEAMTKGINSSA